MSITLVRANDLTCKQLAAWSRLQRADRTLDSPFFRPEFTQAVASVRGDVEVAIQEENGQPVGFFPFQRTPWNTGKPVGSPISDFQGLIAREGLVWKPEELIRGCGLASWDYNHLVAAQQPFQPYHYHWIKEFSPYMDLTGGFDVYQAERRKAGSREINKTMRKARKMAREVGAISFTSHTTDHRVLEKLIEWKTNQYRQSEQVNIFGFPWVVEMLERIVRETTEGFSGMLSALYVGDRLAAVHLGIRSHYVLHSWFPAYDPIFAKYSPGLNLLVGIAKAARSLGVRRVDLGKGQAEYKTNLMSGVIPLAEGSVDSRPVARLLKRGWRRTRDWIRSTRLHTAGRLPARVMRRALLSLESGSSLNSKC